MPAGQIEGAGTPVSALLLYHSLLEKFIVRFFSLRQRWSIQLLYAALLERRLSPKMTLI
jgi:hypothetical protein